MFLCSVLVSSKNSGVDEHSRERERGAEGSVEDEFESSERSVVESEVIA